MIESGLRRLEIGQLAICKFGESVKTISDFGDYGGSSLGGKLINELSFGQSRTDLVNLLKCSRKVRVCWNFWWRELFYDILVIKTFEV